MGSDQQMAAPERPAQVGAPPSDTIIHRKAQAGRAEHQARAMSLGKALRLTLAKVADEMFDMSMAVIGVRSDTCMGEALSDQLEPSGLLLLLEGPERSRAAAILDGAFVGALIQQQTMGKVLPEVEENARAFTQTDAAICAPFMNALLERAAPVPEDPNDQRLIAGYRFGAWIENTRLLCMALEAERYTLLNLSVDIAGGARQGKILLCMPKSTAPKGGHKADQDTTGADDESAHPHPTATLSETVLNLNADLRIALAQIRLPLGEMNQFAVGKTLPLAHANFDRVKIQTISGAPVGRGKLGQLEGQRAVQVEMTNTAPPHLKRRASDRGDLNLPDISAPAARGIPEDVKRSGELTDLPDMSDLPDMTDLPELPDMSDAPEIEASGELRDLPDMSDLPDFDEDESLPIMNAS